METSALEYFGHVKKTTRAIIIAIAITMLWVISLSYYFLVIEDGLQYFEFVFNFVFYGTIMAVFTWIGSFFTYMEYGR